MTIRHLFYTGALALPVALSLQAAQSRVTEPRVDSYVIQGESGFAQRPPAPWADADPADSLYRAGREAINRGDFRRAAAIFAEIGTKHPRSEYAADALYWRAFALYRAGREEDLREALRSLESQKKRFPKAKTVADAEELDIRIRGVLAQRGDPDAAQRVSSKASESTQCSRGDDNDDDIKSAAINALMQMDAHNAIPIIKQLLAKRDACSVAMRKKAVFLLSQKPSPETESMMIDVIRNDPSREVQLEAVWWMGQINSERAAATLEEIATSSPDVKMREKAVFALSQQNRSRASAIIRRLAESNDTPRSVREQAIFQLGQQRSSDNAEFLRALFGKLGRDNDALRKNVLFSLSQMQGMGNDRWLLSVALDRSQSDDVRKHALWTAGQAGIPGSELVSLYDKLTDAELKGQLIWVLSEARGGAATDKLVEIAQNDSDREMRKKAIFWLGQKNDPRILKIITDIITKP